MNFCKRRGTKAAKKLPDDFQTLKAKYLERIKAKVKQFNIPPQLIINIGETGVPIVPVSQWTLEETGSTSVPITGLDDKRQITALLACTVCGDLLDPQLLYQGTTERCHPPRYVKFSGRLGHLAFFVTLVYARHGEKICLEDSETMGHSSESTAQTPSRSTWFGDPGCLQGTCTAQQMFWMSLERLVLSWSMYQVTAPVSSSPSTSVSTGSLRIN